MPIDVEMIEYLKSLNIKFSIIITKIDKANQSQKYKVKNQAMSLGNDVEIFLVSATKKIGLNDLIEFYNL
jgi:probable GTP-binding protein engB